MKLSGHLVGVSMLVALVGCSSSESQRAVGNSIPGACVGPNCQTSEGAKNDYDLFVDLGAGGSTAAQTKSAGPASVTICGLSSLGCNPDDEASCAHAVLNTNGQGGAASGDPASSGGTAAVGVGGATLSMGLAGAAGSTESRSSAGGAASEGSSSSASGGGVGGGTNAALVGDAPLACRIVLSNAVPRATCELAGAGVAGDTCASRSDCAPGFACAEENGTAQCRHYCCEGDSVCPSGTYCDERDIRESDNQAIRVRVSVCMPAMPFCNFDDPFPCPADQKCSCPTGKACGVVRSDGTAACVVPGAGQEGEACPCAANYVCSDTLGTCVRTCSLKNAVLSAEQCASGVCQSSTSLPANVGVCVSSAAIEALH